MGDVPKHDAGVVAKYKHDSMTIQTVLGVMNTGVSWCSSIFRSFAAGRWRKKNETVVGVSYTAHNQK